MSSMNIWRTVDGERYFLISNEHPHPPGSIEIVTLTGKTARVAAEWLQSFEISEAQARRVAKSQLGDALGDLRGAMDETLAGWRERLEQSGRDPVHDRTTVTPNAASALVGLLKELPRAIGAGLSGDERRVAEARNVLARVESELKDAGIDVKGRLGEFPDRVASIRTSGKESQNDTDDR